MVPCVALAWAVAGRAFLLVAGPLLAPRCVNEGDDGLLHARVVYMAVACSLTRCQDRPNHPCAYVPRYLIVGTTKETLDATTVGGVSCVAA